MLQSALTLQRPGRYQIEAGIAALHDDAATADETDWPQILAWYDDLVTLSDDPVNDDPAVLLARAVAIGHVVDPETGLKRRSVFARCSLTGTVGTPSVAISTSWATTSRRRRAPTPQPRPAPPT